MSLFQTDRILIPIDFSEASFKTQAETLDFVGNPACLHIIHVLPRLNPAEPGMAWHTVDEKTRKNNVLKVLHQRFSEPEYQGMTFHIAIGDPGTEIIDYAQKNEIHLIVISSHGYTGVKRFLIGSVTERVVRHAPCPVLVMRR